MPAKAATLNDVISALKDQNALVEKQTKKQEETDKAIQTLAKVMSEYIGDARLQGLFGESEAKSKSKRPIEARDKSTVLNDIIRQDWLGALFGAGGALAITFGGIFGMFKVFSSIAAEFDPDQYRDFDKKFKGLAIKIGAFFFALDKVLNGFVGIMGRLNLFGSNKLIATIDSIMRSKIRFSPSGVLGFVSSLARFFKWLLVFEIGFKSTVAAFKKFEETDNFLLAFSTFVKTIGTEIITIIGETLKQIYNIIKGVGGKILQWTGLDKFFLDANQKIKDNFGIDLGKYLKMFDENILGWVDNVTNFLTGIVSDLFLFLETGNVGDTFKSIGSFISDKFASFGDSVSGMMDSIFKPMTSAIDGLKRQFQNVIDFIMDLHMKLFKMLEGPKKFLKDLKFPDLNPFDNNKDDKKKVELQRSSQPITMRASTLEETSDRKKKTEMASNSQAITVVNAPSSSSSTAIRTGDMINMPPMNPLNPFDPAFAPVPVY